MFLDPDDDLSTVRSKLEASTAEEIYLVIPQRSPLLRTPLEFRILARVANEVASETILVSGDPNRRRLAEREGFRTKRSLRTLKHLMVEPGKRPPLIVLPDWLPSGAGLLTTAITLAVFGVAAMVVAPVMEVTLTPQTTPLNREVDVLVDPNARQPDAQKGILPGEVLNVRFDLAGALPIPGDRTVGRDKARGEVLITSRNPQPVNLSRSTVVRVPDGPRFLTDSDLRLQPNVPTRIGITAVDPGTGGNVAANTITATEGPGLEGLQVANQRPTAGGTDRQGRVVTAEDHQKLKEQLQEQARARAMAELQQQAGQQRSLPDITLQVRVEDEKMDQPVGAEVDQLTGRLTIQASATAFQNLAFNDLVGKMLLSSAGSGVKLSGEPNISTPAVMGANGQQVQLRSRATGVAERDIDSEGVQTALRGKTEQEALAYLQRIGGLAEAPRINISPDWAPRAFRVDVAVAGPK